MNFYFDKSIYKNMITDFQIFESINRLPRKRLNGEFYHGFSVNKEYDNTDIFHEFDFSYSDWEAVWVSDDEYVADEFSSWKTNDDDDIRVVYKVKVNTTGIADIPYEESQDIMEYFGLSDFRESIPYLKDKGYKGWITPGTIDSTRYDDIALFYPDEQTQILEAKLYINDDWTDYMSLPEAQEMINKHYGIED